MPRTPGAQVVREVVGTTLTRACEPAAVAKHALSAKIPITHRITSLLFDA
jgi:hypothetical protein